MPMPMHAMPLRDILYMYSKIIQFLLASQADDIYIEQTSLAKIKRPLKV